MATRPGGVLQAAQEDTTVLAAVVLLILLGMGYLVLRAGIDKLTGAHQEKATYQLVRDPANRLALVAPDGQDRPPVELDPDQMRRFIDAVDARNEMRLHLVVLPDGEEVPFEDHDPVHDAPRAIVVEDSRGLLRISIAGLIETRPPLDDAVREDLLDVFEGILEASGP